MKRLTSPSAARNREPIVELLRSVAPKHGRALEIASGTGQHMLYFAAAFPSITWQPSDIDPARLASIRDWSTDHAGTNLRPPIRLDASKSDWAATQDTYDLIVLINLLHLIPAEAAHTTLEEIALALGKGGTALIYGPFLRNGVATSPGDAEFHARIQSENPEAGYKDLTDICTYIECLGLGVTTHHMPANNVGLVLQK